MGIYVIGHDDHPNVKVGFTSNTSPKGRVKQLNTGSMGCRLKEYGWLPGGTRHDEQQIHHLLKDAGAHAEGEWFAKANSATKVVLAHCRSTHKNAAKLIIRYLITHNQAKLLPELDPEADAFGWTHTYKNEDTKIIIRSSKKQCWGCQVSYPLTLSFWGKLWIEDVPGSGVYRQQPRCLSCRFADGYEEKDNRTIDLFEQRR